MRWNVLPAASLWSVGAPSRECGIWPIAGRDLDPWGVSPLPCWIAVDRTPPVVACDMPEVTPEFLRPFSTGPRETQPSPYRSMGGSNGCALYGPGCTPFWAEAVQSDEHAVGAVVRRLRCVYMAVDESVSFGNLNTPEEYTAAIAAQSEEL